MHRTSSVTQHNKLLVEIMFYCDILCDERRNYMNKSLEMRECLKSNWESILNI